MLDFPGVPNEGIQRQPNRLFRPPSTSYIGGVDGRRSARLVLLHCGLLADGDGGRGQTSSAASEVGSGDSTRVALSCCISIPAWTPTRSSAAKSPGPFSGGGVSSGVRSAGVATAAPGGVASSCSKSPFTSSDKRTWLCVLRGSPNYGADPHTWGEKNVAAEISVGISSIIDEGNIGFFGAVTSEVTRNEALEFVVVAGRFD